MRVHLIGVAGTAMAALAKLLTDLGHEVTGSDQDVYPPMSTELERLGIAVRTPYRPGNLDPAPELVVVGNAIARGNPELEAALDRGLRYTSQAQAIEDLVLPGRVPVVVTGTHGKTTTSALITWVLRVAGLDPGWMVGGVAHDLPATAALGTGPEFVLEGDEYDTAYFDKRPKFHHYRPRILVVANLEHDHVDIYPTLESVAVEFRRLVNTVPRNGLVVAGADSPEAAAAVARSWAPVVRFALDHPGAEVEALHLRPEGGGTRFELRQRGAPVRDLLLAVPGRFNVRNALAAIAVALHLGISLDLVDKALSTFRGVRRRLEERGREDGVLVLDDFAHHPTAIRETLATVAERAAGGRLWVALEPRSWSMRRRLHQDALPEALAPADVVLLAPVFQAERLGPGEALDLERLAREASALGVDARRVAGAAEVAEVVAAEARPGDVVVLMSNGGFDGVHERVLAALRGRRPA